MALLSCARSLPGADQHVGAVDPAGRPHEDSPYFAVRAAEPAPHPDPSPGPWVRAGQGMSGQLDSVRIISGRWHPGTENMVQTFHMSAREPRTRRQTHLNVPPSGTKARNLHSFRILRYRDSAKFDTLISGSSCISPRWAFIQLRLIQYNISTHSSQIIFGCFYKAAMSGELM
jgi:hypothetical protein